MSIIAKTMATCIELGSQGNVNPTEMQMNQSKIAPAWVIALLVVAEICIVVFFGLIYKVKPGPLIHLDESTIPLLAVFVVSLLSLITISIGNKRIRPISQGIIKAFESRGVSFIPSGKRLFSRNAGNFNGLKCLLSFGFRSGTNLDYYTLDILHKKRLNIGLVCTNKFFNQIAKDFNLPLLKPFGAARIDLSGMEYIKSWAVDKVLGKRLFEDSKIRENLESLVKKVDEISGRVFIDDYGIKLAFMVNVIPEQSLIDTAHALSLSLAQLSYLPATPSGPGLKIKLIKSMILAGVVAFMAIFILTILVGHI
jgi:hypothetical protein